MSYEALAEAAVVVHFAFLAFLVTGGLVALRWRALVWPHLVAVAWSAGIVTVGQPCPLTSLERWAELRAGGQVHAAGFIDRYVEGVVYPTSLTGPVRVLVALVVVASWGLLWRRRPPAGRRLGPAPMTRPTFDRNSRLAQMKTYLGFPSATPNDLERLGE